jgi:hypothetical protein
VPERPREDSAAIRKALAVGLAASAYGVSYGALVVAAGLFALRVPFIVVVIAVAVVAALVRALF